MGNCLKSPTSDDISLLHESQSDRASFGDGTDLDLEPPPPYQVRDCWLLQDRDVSDTSRTNLSLKKSLNVKNRGGDVLCIPCVHVCGLFNKPARCSLPE